MARLGLWTQKCQTLDLNFSPICVTKPAPAMELGLKYLYWKPVQPKNVKRFQKVILEALTNDQGCLWPYYTRQDSLDQCPMSINSDQFFSMPINARSSSLIRHWSYWEELIAINRHWDQCRNFDRHWSALGIAGGSPDKKEKSNGLCKGSLHAQTKPAAGTCTNHWLTGSDTDTCKLYNIWHTSNGLYTWTDDVYFSLIQDNKSCPPP